MELESTPPPPPCDGTEIEARPVAVRRSMELLQMDDPDLKIQAAREIRRLTKNSHRCRRQLRQAVAPLVSMLRVDSPESNEPALLALLNLAVQDEKYVN
ncbi:Armadillo-type fold [Sesbania bispinosa]|nr:Armadillo-type fold [Sesbania bispinosa]